MNFDTNQMSVFVFCRRYKNIYKHPDSLAVADSNFTGETSYTEQFIGTRVSCLDKVIFSTVLQFQTNTPAPARHPWETSKENAIGIGDMEEMTTTRFECSNTYGSFTNITNSVPLLNPSIPESSSKSTQIPADRPSP